MLTAIAFAAAWMVTGAMAAHLPRLHEATGATTVKALAPLAFSLLIDRYGGDELFISSGLSIIALVALCFVHEDSNERLPP